MIAGPVRLEPAFHEKIWGSTALEPWFHSRGEKTGEAWFPAEEILVKFIFTTDRLSIQVHPPGKTEMWHILRAEPSARIALGLRRSMTSDQLREAALSGAIEDELTWVPVRPGESYLLTPGTVHTIGGGIVLCEIQQNYPVTYRLYDYGRPRELQLDKAVAVARCEPHPGKAPPVALPDGGRRLVACDYFITDAFRYTEPATYRPDPDRYHLLIIIEGKGAIAGEPFTAGQLWRIPAAGAPFAIDPDGPVRMLRTCLPRR